MWDFMRRSSIELLEPRTPEDRRALYDLVRDALRATGASSEAIQLVALSAVRHLSGWGGRILLGGDDDEAKLTLVRTLAEVLDLPYMEIDVSSLAETNWQGADLPFHLERLHAQLEGRYHSTSVPRIVERACVLVSHLERLRVPGTYSGSSSTRDYREGQAMSLCPLAGDGVIPVSRNSRSGFVWPSKRALVIATATFEGLTRAPDAEALELWGIPRPLADLLAAFSWIDVTGLESWALEAAVRKELEGILGRFLAMGFHLRIAEQVVRHVVELVHCGTRAGGVRAAVALVADAADRALMRMLEDRAAPGAVHTLVRDDLDQSWSSPSSGTWRE